MPLIIVSCSSYDCRKELAEDLAKKTGFQCLSREELVDEANSSGIPVGKLEVAVIKAPVMKERLARLKQCYLSFVTARICESLKNGNLIYHGRAGHLLLPGVSHIFRVRVLAEKAYSVREVMRRLKLDREKAVEYMEQVDKDVDSWVRLVHGVDPNDLSQYDMVINLEHMSLPNASAALCQIMELPDFGPTPVSLKAMENHRLAAQARVKLALDERTSSADLSVSADEGVITVRYMPRQAGVAEAVPKICQDLEGCKEILATMAETNILWIQEEYDTSSEVFDQINEVARRWGAAIELLRWMPTESETDETVGGDSGEGMNLQVQTDTEEDVGRIEYTGGIEDDVEEAPPLPDGGVGSTTAELVSVGRSGGSQTVYGTRDKLLAAIRKDVEYSLAVIGNVYVSKPHAVQMRMTRDVRGFLQDRFKMPVIEASELGTRFLVGKRHFMRLLIFLAFVVGIYIVIFSNQMPILNFLGGEFHKHWPWLTAIAVAVFVPLVAYLYSTVTGLVLKLIQME